MDRRKFISMFPAGAAALMYSCKAPEEEIVPLVTPVEYMKPGEAVHYSSVYTYKNTAYGVQITTYDGRPVKIDGNPEHPINGGASTVQMQASIFDLYNPARIWKPSVGKDKLSLDKAIDAAKSKIEATEKEIAVIIDEHCSPCFDKLINDIESANSRVKFYTLPPMPSPAASVNRDIFGLDGEMVPDLSKPDLIISIGSDFLGTEKNSLYHARQFSSRRSPGKDMNRLVTVETGFSKTGAISDDRIALSPEGIVEFLSDILRRIAKTENVEGINELLELLPDKVTEQSGLMAEELISKKGKAVLMPGNAQPRAVHALAALINYYLGSIGLNKYFSPYNTLPFSSDKLAGIKELKEKLKSEQVLFSLLAGYDNFVCADQELEKLVLYYPLINIFLSYFETDNFNQQPYRLPVSHWLESWGDSISFDGTRSIRQPMISPLNEDSASLEELLMKIFLDAEETGYNSYYDYLADFHSETFSDEKKRREALRTGILEHEVNYPEYKELSPDIEKAVKIIKDDIREIFAGGLKFCIIPSHSFQRDESPSSERIREIPDSINKECFENAVIMNPKTARKHSIQKGDILSIKTDKAEINLPALIIPGIADNILVSHFGMSRLKNRDQNSPVRLIDSFDDFHYFVNIKLGKTSQRVDMPSSKSVIVLDSIDGIREFLNGDIPEEGTLAETNSINPGYEYKGNHWGMLVDMNLCTACSACIAACQVENNIPTVGQDEMKLGRSMHWLRLDSYFTKNDDDQVEFRHQLMMCQHCDEAPCETVCPVSASTHSPEGLNETTYNRCVGTRYCMTNCPYKVRKFNYFNYSEESFDGPVELACNPNVTVRMRGIVEKCTFCVQRINKARYEAKDLGLKTIPDDMIKTACEQACPTGAIRFGDFNNKESLLSKARENPRAYHALPEYNTKPSIVYLAKVRNKNTGS